MANFNSKDVLLVGLKGDRAFIRYSANADGTGFTETWSSGQNYIGFMVGSAASTDKADYTWALFKGEKGDLPTIEQTTGQSTTKVMSQKAVTDELEDKVDKVAGKGLSANDYTSAEKTKLAGIEAQANKTVVDSALSDSSTNPVQNKKVKEAIDEVKEDLTYQPTVTTYGLNDGEEHNGIIDYDDTWWKYASTSYKHTVIPVRNGKNILSITAGSHDCRIAGVKTYTQPASGVTIDFSLYWNRNILISAGSTLNTIIPDDVNYLIVNTLYALENCVSSLTITDNVFSVIGEVNNRTKGIRNEITIGAHNIRDFNVEGGTGEGCPDNLVATNLPLWKNHISKSLNTDFLCIDEWYHWFDHSQTIDAYNEIFKQFYPYKYELPSANPTQMLLSKHNGVMFALGELVAGQFKNPTMVCNIGGKSVAIVCWLQSSVDSYSTRIAYYNKVIPFLNAFDIVILAGDFNTQDTSHFDDEMNVWKNAGYTVGNGGYWGKINTWSTYPLDNIVVKGAIYEDFEVGSTITSDHKAVKSKVSIIS